MTAPFAQAVRYASGYGISVELSYELNYLPDEERQDLPDRYCQFHTLLLQAFDANDKQMYIGHFAQDLK